MSEDADCKLNAHVIMLHRPLNNKKLQLLPFKEIHWLYTYLLLFQITL